MTTPSINQEIDLRFCTEIEQGSPAVSVAPALTPETRPHRRCRFHFVVDKAKLPCLATDNFLESPPTEHCEFILDTSHEQPLLVAQNIWVRERDGLFTVRRVKPGDSILHVKEFQGESEMLRFLKKRLPGRAPAAQRIRDLELQPIAMYTFVRKTYTKDDIHLHIDEQKLSSVEYFLVATIEALDESRDHWDNIKLVIEKYQLVQTPWHSKAVQALAMYHPSIFDILQQNGQIAATETRQSIRAPVYHIPLEKHLPFGTQDDLYRDSDEEVDDGK